MAAPAYMKMYWSDYLTDTRRLTPEEHGCYLLLIATMWSEADHSLPNDPKILCRVTGANPRRWAKIWAAISPYFEVDGAHIVHKRVRKELISATEKSLARAEYGARGGEAKALKDKDAQVAKATAKAMAEAMASSTESIKKEYTPPTPPMGGAANDPDGVGKPKAKPKRSAAPSPWFAAFFERFWAAWPNKVDRKRAEVALWKAWPSIPPDPAAGDNTAEGRCLTLLASVAAYDAWRLKHDYKLSGPTPWINGARWADDYGAGAKAQQKERFAI